jgi:hypothetical protein
MSAQGLDAILNKNEIVSTHIAQDLIDHPELVEDGYRRHVRTYIPISRTADAEDSVERFASRLFRAIKERKAPRGYLTARYGYGKTSTAVHLWHTAEETQDLVAVPPFTLTSLRDLITATHGWVRYRISQRQPALLSALDELYQRILDIGAKALSERRGIPEAVLYDMIRAGEANLDLRANDYLQYFEGVSALVTQAGYSGLLLMPDEIQQYTRNTATPNSQPIRELFDLIQALMTREGQMNFGLLMVITTDEIALIREISNRDDLIQRLSQYKLDLNSLYSASFARNLWGLMAKEFDFTAYADRIISPDALDSLGEIASREDLSNGPRTVVNAFRLAVRRYTNQNGAIDPYTPYDLIQDFLEGNIGFSGNDTVVTITRQAMQNSTVERIPNGQAAVMMAAAFPVSGMTERRQKAYGLTEAFEQLYRAAHGELIISVGPVTDSGFTLKGLDQGVKQTDWFSTQLRDFRRAYNLDPQALRNRAMEGFVSLLKERVFRVGTTKNNWTIKDERERNDWSQNRAILLQGDFQSFTATYPQRRAYVRVLWEDEPIKDVVPDDYDLTVNYRLKCYAELEREQQRQYVESIDFNRETGTITIPVNLMYVRLDNLSPQIQQVLNGIWSPMDVNPMVLLNIYSLLEEKRKQGLIPASDDAHIKNAYQPALLDAALPDVFNDRLGGSLGTGANITEALMRQMLEALYPNYVTLSVSGQWRASLADYGRALERLSNDFQRRGEATLEINRDKLADLLGIGTASLDARLRIYGQLITLERPPSSKADGEVRFTLHDLEKRIWDRLRHSDRVERIKSGKEFVNIHKLDRGEVRQMARSLGYREDELEEVLKLLEKRHIIESPTPYEVREAASSANDVDVVYAAVKTYHDEAYILQQGFPDDAVYAEHAKRAQEWLNLLDQQRNTGKIDGEQITRIDRSTKVHYSSLLTLRTDKQKALIKDLQRIRQALKPINGLDVLDKLAIGSVNYVEQVNALRNALRQIGEKTKTKVEQSDLQLKELSAKLDASELSPHNLVKYAKELDDVDGRVKEASKLADELERQISQLRAWVDLVRSGSELLNEIHRMGKVGEPFVQRFNELSARIRETISTTANKLHALPNYVQHKEDLDHLRREAKQAADSLNEEFMDKQNVYRNVLLSNRLARPEDFTPITFNFGNPDESYQQLYREIRRLLGEAIAQIRKHLTKHRSELNGLTVPVLLETLPEDERGGFAHDTDEWLAFVDQNMENLAQQEAHIDTPGTVENVETFPQLATEIARVLGSLKDIQTQYNKLNSRVQEAKLTTDEERLNRWVAQCSEDEQIDIIDWMRNAKAEAVNEETFWEALRGLLNKRHITLFAKKIRR